MRAWTVLGLETSCDETAASVVRGTPPGPGEILSNVVFSQLEEHRPYGGVVPEIAARAHVEALDGIIDKALNDAGVTLNDLDAVAATAGPGLIGGVMVGLVSGKALAAAAHKPLIGINHLEAHALAARLTGHVKFPFLLLLISGGHCQLLAAKGVNDYHLYGTTIDDAAGEAFDKVAKLLNLPYPGGPQVELHAKNGDPKRYHLPRPLHGRPGCDFSFSGLKTAVREQVIHDHVDHDDMCASFQRAVVDILKERVGKAMTMFRNDFPEVQNPDFVVAGGVAANTAIRETLSALVAEHGFSLSAPPPKLCTDNGAMIAWAGVEHIALGLTTPLNCPARARWPLFKETETA